MMAQRTETRTAPAREYEVIVSTTCDICGLTVGRDASESWSKDPHKRDRVTIEREFGSAYPDGASIEAHTYDVCPECWDSTVVPLMTGLGALRRVEDRSW